ncbi:probable aspartate kinase [Cephalotrichum gorgonifer]|uniref:Aspartokinase n=1 Tax=Cephalotrichum gorgonifer TaxID=2041049 RepID=A0AAE8SU08_9PEZI|nr:probable aspartate kinase [Cephalotrichum gorgonifer]
MAVSCLADNSSAHPWVVQKFGGTSVGKFPDRIASDIVCDHLARYKVVVVCSARSTGKKAEGTTSRLLLIFQKLEEINAAVGQKDIQCERLEEARELINAICRDHIAAVESYIRDTDLRASLCVEIEEESRELIEYVEAAKRFKLEADSRSKDRIVSVGEKLSCRFMTTMLKDRGVDAEYVDICDAFRFPPTSRIDSSFYKEVTQTLRKRLEACGARVPVVTGFFGNVPGSLIDGEIGRGYTDLCSALCAVATKAQELQVWKEVDGIFTADPTKVPTARLLPSITPSEAAELTFYGSEVIHHLTMDQVMHADPPIPIRIKNVKNPRGYGTIVIPDKVHSAGQPLVHHRKPIETTKRKTPKRPTAVTIKDKISVINVHSNKRSISHGFFARVFSILHAHKISVDLISTSEVHVSLAIHYPSSDGKVLKQATEELGECGDVSILHKMAILSLVGADMKNMIGIAGKMFSTLGEHNVNLEMISQGASEINISCVVEARDATRAMNVLHTHLFTFLE